MADVFGLFQNPNLQILFPSLLSSSAPIHHHHHHHHHHRFYHHHSAIIMAILCIIFWSTISYSSTSPKSILADPERSCGQFGKDIKHNFHNIILYMYYICHNLVCFILMYSFSSPPPKSILADPKRPLWIVCQDNTLRCNEVVVYIQFADGTMQ